MLEIIKVMGLFVPKIVEHLLKVKKKKVKVCHFIINYIFVHKSVDGLEVKVLYDLFGIDNNYKLRSWFNDAGLSWWLIYYLLEDCVDYTSDEKLQIMDYIQNNEQFLNSWTNYKPQTAVQRYLNNCTGVSFLCYMIFLLLYITVVFPELSIIENMVIAFLLPAFLIILCLVRDMFGAGMEKGCRKGGLRKLLEVLYKKNKRFRIFIDKYTK